MTRTCLDCPAEISVKSSGRCRRCANQHVNRSDEHRRARAESMRRRLADPAERAALQARTQRGIDKKMLDPEFVAAKRRAGLAVVATNLVRGRTPEARAKAGPGISAAKLAHIPEGYRDLYRSLRSRNWSAARRLAYVLDRKAEDDHRARIAGLSAVDAADFLRRVAPILRCNPDGSLNPRGTHWRRGSAVLAAEDVIERALAKGWNPDAWRLVA